MPVGFVKVATVSEISERRSKRIKVGDEEIALWRVDGAYYAINNVCCHQHIPALHLGILDGHQVSCPMHGWTYSLLTGREETGQGKVRTYRVLVERDCIYIEEPAPLW